MAPRTVGPLRPFQRRLLRAFLVLFALLPAGCIGKKETEAVPVLKPAEGGEAGQGSKGPVEITLTPEAVEKYGIRVEKAEKRVLTPTFVAPGRVAFDTERMSYVGSAVTGRVAELKVRIGDPVKKGDVLLVVDSPEFASLQAEYRLKRSGVKAAKPSVDVTRELYLRAKKTFDDSDGKSMTLTEVQKRENDFRAAEGALLLAEASVDAAVSRLEALGFGDAALKALDKTLDAGGKIDSRFVIRSPIAGQVLDRPVTLGELVRPEKESLLTVADLSTVWVLADVPEAQLGELAVGADAFVKMTAGADTLSGKLSYLPPQLDPATRTAPVRIEVGNPKGALRAGVFAQVEIATGKPDPQSEPAVAVPDEAVQTIDGKPCVFVPVAGKEHTFVKRVLALGPTAGGWVTVEAGLKAGEPFVRSGTFVLKAELGKSSLEE